jgi:hypothetical protein
MLASVCVIIPQSLNMARITMEKARSGQEDGIHSGGTSVASERLCSECAVANKLKSSISIGLLPRSFMGEM